MPKIYYGYITFLAFKDRCFNNVKNKKFLTIGGTELILSASSMLAVRNNTIKKWLENLNFGRILFKDTKIR